MRQSVFIVSIVLLSVCVSVTAAEAGDRIPGVNQGDAETAAGGVLGAMQRYADAQRVFEKAATQVVREHDSILALSCFDSALALTSRLGAIFSDRPAIDIDPRSEEAILAGDDLAVNPRGDPEFSEQTEGFLDNVDGFMTPEAIPKIAPFRDNNGDEEGDGGLIQYPVAEAREQDREDMEIRRPAPGIEFQLDSTIRSEIMPPNMIVWGNNAHMKRRLYNPYAGIAWKPNPKDPEYVDFATPQERPPCLAAARGDCEGANQVPVGERQPIPENETDDQRIRREARDRDDIAENVATRTAALEESRRTIGHQELRGPDLDIDSNDFPGLTAPPIPNTLAHHLLGSVMSAVDVYLGGTGGLRMQEPYNEALDPAAGTIVKGFNLDGTPADPVIDAGILPAGLGPMRVVLDYGDQPTVNFSGGLAASMGANGTSALLLFTREIDGFLERGTATPTPSSTALAQLHVLVPSPVVTGGAAVPTNLGPIHDLTQTLRDLNRSVSEFRGSGAGDVYGTTAEVNSFDGGDLNDQLLSGAGVMNRYYGSKAQALEQKYAVFKVFNDNTFEEAKSPSAENAAVGIVQAWAEGYLNDQTGILFDAGSSMTGLSWAQLQVMFPQSIVATNEDAFFENLTDEFSDSLESLFGADPTAAINEIGCLRMTKLWRGLPGNGLGIVGATGGGASNLAPVFITYNQLLQGASGGTGDYDRVLSRNNNILSGAHDDLSKRMMVPAELAENPEEGLFSWKAAPVFVKGTTFLDVMAVVPPPPAGGP